MEIQKNQCSVKVFHPNFETPSWVAQSWLLLCRLVVSPLPSIPNQKKRQRSRKLRAEVAQVQSSVLPKAKKQMRATWGRSAIGAPSNKCCFFFDGNFGKCLSSFLLDKPIITHLRSIALQGFSPGCQLFELPPRLWSLRWRTHPHRPCCWSSARTLACYRATEKNKQISSRSSFIFAFSIIFRNITLSSANLTEFKAQSIRCLWPVPGGKLVLLGYTLDPWVWHSWSPPEEEPFNVLSSNVKTGQL